MKKKLLVLVLMALLILSFAYSKNLKIKDRYNNAKLGKEMVTCGEFDCATPNDYWSNLGTASCQSKWFIAFGIPSGTFLRISCLSPDPTNTNTSQDISFEAGKSYNLTLDIRLIEGKNNITVYISDNSTFFDDGDSVTIQSRLVIPKIDGNLTINGQGVSTVSNDRTIISSISVKEIKNIKAKKIIPRKSSSNRYVFRERSI